MAEIDVQTGIDQRNNTPQRMKGEKNDDTCETHGITLWVSLEVKAKIEKLMKLSLTPEQTDGNLTEIHFPNAYYVAGMGGVQFFEKGERRGDFLFGLNYDDVVRVQSTSGDLWQNKNHTWN